jgi:hypothetical protein
LCVQIFLKFGVWGEQKIIHKSCPVGKVAQKLISIKIEEKKKKKKKKEGGSS